MESTQAVTTDSVMWLVGVRGDVVTRDNHEELARRLSHPFLQTLDEGDVIWPVKDKVKKRIHLCVVRMARTPEEPPTGLISREMGLDHRGTVRIVGGTVVLSSEGRTFDMLTCLPWKPTN